MIGGIIAVVLWAIGAAQQKLALDFAVYGKEAEVRWYHYWLIILGWPVFALWDSIENFNGPE